MAMGHKISWSSIFFEFEDLKCDEMCHITVTVYELSFEDVLVE